jgi:hypothetical protein
MRPECIRLKIAHFRMQIRAQRWDIRNLEHAGLSTKLAEELLMRMQDKVDEISAERDRKVGELRMSTGNNLKAEITALQYDRTSMKP